MEATRPSSAWDRYAWVAGILFVVALAAEAVVAIGVGVNQDDPAAKIANALHEHRKRLLVIAYLSVVYAAMFPIYLSRLHNLLRGDPSRPRVLGPLVLAGGVLFVALHAVSDVGITGLLGAKLASFGFQHDLGVSYTLYLMTFALDSVGDVFGSLFALAAGLLVIGSGVLPRWLGWVSILVGILFFLQGFGLGGVIATFGLVLDGIGFVLFLIFVLVSSVIFLRRESAVPGTSGGIKLSASFVQQEVQQRGRTPARIHDRRHHELAAEVGQSSYTPVVCIQVVWPLFGRTTTLNVAAYCAPVSSIRNPR